MEGILDVLADCVVICYMEGRLWNICLRKLLIYYMVYAYNICVYICKHTYANAHIHAHTQVGPSNAHLATGLWYRSADMAVPPFFVYIRDTLRRRDV